MCMCFVFFFSKALWSFVQYSTLLLLTHLLDLSCVRGRFDITSRELAVGAKQSQASEKWMQSSIIAAIKTFF